MKQRILFVDDESRLLDGLGRLLRGQRQAWSAEFATGGREALIKLAAAPFDIVISDMRMPEMDAAEFLTEVRQHYPQIIRFVLASHYDKEAFLRLSGLAHQRLSKPCDPLALQQALARAGELRSLLASERLRALASQLESIPTQPAVYSAFVQALETGDESSGAKVGALARRDVGLTAKLMQLASSVSCGQRRPASHPEKAAVALGSDLLKALVRGGRAFSEFKSVSLNPLSIGAVWRHSLATSVLARKIALVEGCDAAFLNMAAIAGLLHDIGILIFAQQLPEPCNHAWSLTRDEGLTLSDAEREVFGASHAEIGAYLLGLWGQDPSIVQAVAWHHHPDKYSGTAFAPLTTVHVADILTCEDDSYPGISSKATIDEDYLDKIGMLDHLPRWRDLAHEDVREGSYAEVACS